MATMHANMKATARFEPLEPWAATRRRKGVGLFAARAIVALVLLCSLLLAAWPADAAERAFENRFHTTKPGDIVAIGNVVLNCAPYGDTSNADCNSTREHPFPTGGMDNNDFPARYIKVDPSGPGSNNSRATLSIPAGAKVEFAGLYWSGAQSPGLGPGDRVAMRTPGKTTYQTVNAEFSDWRTDGLMMYQSYANVTGIVAGAGSGDYYVGDIETLAFGINTWAGWSLVVVYSMKGLPLRDLAVFDGWKYATTTGAPLDVKVDGFTTPLSGPVASRLGVLVWDGDRPDLEKGSLEFGPDIANLSPVSNAINPANNFWNSTISFDGALVEDGMDPNYLNTLGMDLDVVTPAVPLPNGATSAVARLRGSLNESIYIGMVSLVNDAYLPSLDDRLKASKVEDASGKLYPGGVLTYTIEATNKGSAAATDVVVTDEIPEGTTYVPGSLKIIENSGSGPVGDMKDGITSDGDQAAYDGTGTNKRVIFWLGQGGGPNNGGSVAQGDTIRVQFQVKVDDDAEDGDKISNQAHYDYFAEQLQTTVQDESDADLDTEDINEPTINDVVGKSADLAITKTASANSVGNGGTVEYTIVVTNNGPDSSDGAVVQDPVVTGIDCTGALSCDASGNAACPASPTINGLQTTGLVIPTLPDGGQVTLRMTCTLSVP